MPSPHPFSLQPTARAPCDPPAASDELFAELYDELRRLARREVRRCGAQSVMSTRTLVHEAWLDISQRHGLAFGERGRFLAYAARAMRGLVIDGLRAQQAQKRGGGLEITGLDTQQAQELAQPMLPEHVAEALDAMAAIEPALVTLVELKFFAGLSMAEIAELQGVSERTVQRQWEKARMLLYRALKEG
ncbi:MAG TPA: ECF-type sigma factor [Albitalea sp.]|nr:ECF-type sigma factor [Albitalea sp.]